MSRMVACLFAALMLITGSASAQCTVPNTLTNGNNADAAQVMANFTAILTCINSLPPPTAAPTSFSPRQTVSAGPVVASGTTAGLPNFLPATAGSLSLTTQNVNAAAPLAVTAANNVDSTTGVPKDLVGVTTSNLTWSSLTASSTLYLYVTVATNGTLTTGATTQAPVYQWGGTPATTNGLFTFNISEMKGYLGNGSTAPQAYVVFVGEAVTSGSAVTSTVAYAYNGRYDSGFTPTVTIAGTTRPHNIGVVPKVLQYVIECTTADAGYAVGETLVNGVYTASTNSGVIAVYASRNTLGLPVTINAAAIVKGTGNMITALTFASWKYKLAADRGW